MAVVNDKSPEYLSQTDPRANGILAAEKDNVGLFIKPFNFVQGAAAGDITSTPFLIRLPAGRIIVFPQLSFIQGSAFGAARTLDLGYAAYTGEDGVAVVAAPTAFNAAIDVSGATKTIPGAGIAAGKGSGFLFKSQSGVDIIGTVAGGTIPAAATLTGFFAVGIIGAM